MSIAPRQLDRLPAMDALAARVKCGRAIRDVRCRRGVKATVVADAVGLSSASLSLFETGEKMVSLPRVLAIVGMFDTAPDLARTIVELVIQAGSRGEDDARLMLRGFRLCSAPADGGVRGDEAELRRVRDTLRRMLAVAENELTRADVAEMSIRQATQFAAGVAVPISGLVVHFAGTSRAERMDAALAWLTQLSPVAWRGQGETAIVYSLCPLPVGVTAGEAVRSACGERGGRPARRFSLALFNAVVDAVAANPSVAVRTLHDRLRRSQEELGRVPSRDVVGRLIEKFRAEWLDYVGMEGGA